MRVDTGATPVAARLYAYNPDFDYPGYWKGSMRDSGSRLVGIVNRMPFPERLPPAGDCRSPAKFDCQYDPYLILLLYKSVTRVGRADGRRQKTAFASLPR